MKSIEDKIFERIHRRGPGACFTPWEFLAVASPVAVWKALSRLAKDGRIRRLAKGLYDYPEHHRDLGALPPAPEDVARALSARDHTSIIPSGAYAANLLGLSEQVPAKVVFLTSGPTRKARIGRQEILLKHTTPRNMEAANRVSGLVIQALRFIGADQLTIEQLDSISSRLSASERKIIGQDKTLAPAWMRPHLEYIAAGGS